MANEANDEAADDDRSLLERLNDADPGSDEWNELIDAMITQDMALGPARKKMIEAGRKRSTQSDRDSDKGK